MYLNSHNIDLWVHQDTPSRW